MYEKYEGKYRQTLICFCDELTEASGNSCVEVISGVLRVSHENTTNSFTVIVIANLLGSLGDNVSLIEPVVELCCHIDPNAR